MSTLKNIQKRAEQLNFFEGEDALKKFLNPDYSPPTPMVELPEELNPFRKEGVRIFAKLMNFLPLGNVKSLPAYNMLLEKAEVGDLDKVEVLIENSSGNTVFSLAAIGRAFGIQRTKAIVSNEVTRGKLQLLRLFGTEIVINEEPICPDPKDKTSGIYKAKQLGKRKGYFNPGQYDNEANWRAHEKWTGPQIWDQTTGKVTLVCMGLGTTGTMVGAAKYLKNKNPKIRTVGVVRNPNNPVPGVRTINLLNQIAFDWKKSTDETVGAGTKESYAKSLMMCRRGLIVGPSSGFALTGLLSFLEKTRKKSGFESFRNKEGEVIAVFICPDSPLPYLDEYFTSLKGSYFPKIENEDLLINKPKEEEENKNRKANEVLELPPQKAYKLLYSESPEILWRLLREKRKIELKKEMRVIDVREKEEFKHFSIPGSTNIELSRLGKTLKRYKNKEVIFVCARGVRSKVATEMAIRKGIRAFSLKGGTIEWSRLNFPRIRPEICLTRLN